MKTKTYTEMLRPEDAMSLCKIATRSEYRWLAL